MIKLVFGAKNKIIKLQNRNFQQLRQVIQNNFPEAPVDYSLSYIDEDKDQICLNSDQDLHNMLKPKAKVYKVYIKQSLTQTIVVDLDCTQTIEASFLQSSASEAPKKEEESTKEEIKSNVEGTILQKQALVEKKEEVIEDSLKKKEKGQESRQLAKVNQQKVQQKVEQIIEIPRQRLQISEVIEKKSQKLQVVPVRLLVEDEKRVVSKVQEMNKPDNLKVIDKQSDFLFEEVKQKEFVHCKPKKFIEKKDQSLQVHNVICSNCKDDFGILGVRYQCILCNHFNLCSKCQVEIDHQHALLKVKVPAQAITEKILSQKFKKEIHQPVKHQEIPHGHYIPSIEKEDAYRILKTAKQAYEDGMNRANKLIQELFNQLEASHKNPYEVMKPIAQKVQTSGEKAKYLSELVGISYNQAIRFVSQYPTLDKQRTTEIYFGLKK